MSLAKVPFRANFKRFVQCSKRSLTIGITLPTVTRFKQFPSLKSLSPNQPTARYFGTTNILRSDVEYISEIDFRKLSDKALAHILDHLDEQFDDLGSQFDLDYSMGVLNISLQEKGSYVLNQQPPNRQIWFSSPISGPMRFEYDPKEESWKSTKSGDCLFELLSSELSQLLETSIIIPKI
ncbi:hypothetical protein BB560_002398 [Smittium megazygosporum]|uniref:ferroxidase n=1 Tax=Smittium megazygosporum TaxID=133381 RepID=A0A2T9ZEW0_9FUNG|nr:hypothetical protein BB560_002398 [Smittium megazygosporum]